MHGPGDVRFFDRFARLYDAVMPRAKSAPLARGLSAAVGPVERVVDVGGGSGRATLALDAPRRIVLDRSRGMLDRARKRTLEVVQADAMALPFADESVDAVTVVDALHHLPNQRRAVSEAFRVLRPGGVLVVREFDPETLRGRALVSLESLVRFDSTFTGPDDLARFVEALGFEARVTDYGFEYTVVGQRPLAIDSADGKRGSH